MAKKTVTKSADALTKTTAAETATNSATLPMEGYVRLKQILAPSGPIPVSRATWWAGVKTGRYPQPTKMFGPGITAWDVADIRALLAQAKLAT